MFVRNFMCPCTRVLLATFMIIVFFNLPANAEILFYDDFNDSNADGWEEIIGAPWTVIDGEYEQNLSGVNVLSRTFAGDESWSNYSLQVDMIGLAGVDKIIDFRRQLDNDSWYGFVIRSNWSGEDEILLKKHANDPTGIVAAVAQYPTQRDVWYTVRVELHDENIKLYIKERSAESFDLVMDYYDVDPVVTNGKIGFTCWTGAVGACHVRYDNVIVETPTTDEWAAAESAEASTYTQSSLSRSEGVNSLAIVLLPLVFLLVLKVLQARPRDTAYGTNRLTVRRERRS